jgi:uncharacterized membrane protein HdeD (DUF308 family)
MAEYVSEARVGESNSGWWLLSLVGLLSIVAGVIILFKPDDSLATLAVIAGIFLLVNGILELIASFMRSTSDRGLVALFGVLSVIVGVLLIRHPIGGVEFVAILVGLWLITVGVIRFATAFDEYAHRFWHGLAGALAMIAGVIIIVDPNIGFATLALLVGIGFIANGIGLSALGWGLRDAGR